MTDTADLYLYVNDAFDLDSLYLKNTLVLLDVSVDEHPALRRFACDAVFRVLNADCVIMRYPPQDYAERNDRQYDQRTYPFHLILLLVALTWLQPTRQRRSASVGVLWAMTSVSHILRLLVQDDVAGYFI